MLGLICGIKGCIRMKQLKTDNRVSQTGMVMESGGVIWIGVWAVAWIWNVVRYGMR